MKRMTSLVLALILALGLVASAAAEQLPPLEGPVGIAERPPFERPDLQGDRASSRFPQPNDTVTIKDGIFTITTKGATIELEAPFGWLVLTQDISKQMADYALFGDPLATVSFVIDNDLSILALDANNTNLMVYSTADGISALVGALDDEMLEFVNTYYGSEAAKIGDTNYARVLEGDRLIYLTFHNGVRIGFQLYMAGTEPTQEETEMLEDFISYVKYI